MIRALLDTLAAMTTSDVVQDIANACAVLVFIAMLALWCAALA